MKRFASLILGLLIGAAGAADPAGMKVAVRRVDVDAQHAYEVNASGDVRAAPAAVWRILTGYERMAEFVPDLASCKILSRRGNEVVVEQVGTARFLFMSRQIHLVVRATETPMSAIDIALLSGDMRYYASRWELQPLAATGGTRIVYRGTLAPDFYVPGMLGAHVIGGDIARMMQALLARIDDNRDAAPAASPAPQAR
jgi:ribosome-associated toxin RatA of RatAB toxin-antitoxin module